MSEDDELALKLGRQCGKERLSRDLVRLHQMREFLARMRVKAMIAALLPVQSRLTSPQKGAPNASH